MAIDPFGAAIGVAGLLASFSGAVNGYLLLESVFDQDNGLKDLMTRFRVVQRHLNEWMDRFDVSDRQKCLLQYETEENKKLLYEILDRIEKLLTDAQKLLGFHTPEASQKRSPNFLGRFKKQSANADVSLPHGEEDAHRNRIKWALKNKGKFSENVATLETHCKNLDRRSKGMELLRLPNWTREVMQLTKVDELSHHSRARQLRQEGTGRWLFDRVEFTKWRSGEVKDILWIHGMPGAGKTILASTIIDELCDVIKPSDSNIGIAYFYCDYREPERQKLSEILGSLIAQLSRQNLALRSAVRKYLESLQKTYEAARSVQSDDLKELLIENCGRFSGIFLVLDAIDECPNQAELSYRKLLLNCLTDIQKNGNGRIKVLVTSRPTVDIQKAFLNTPVIPVLSDSNSPDIELYASKELEKAIHEDPDWLGDEENTRAVRNRIVSRLVDKANGMFLFAKLQLDILRNCHSDEDVLAALFNLPEDLDKTWVRLLQDVMSTHSNPRNHEKIKRILKLLVAAVRPLRVDEIKEAIAVEECQMQRNQNSEIRDPKILIGLCGPLVRVNRETSELYLAHFSLKEFLISGKLLETPEISTRKFNINPLDADAYVAMVSLTYLSFSELSRPCKTLMELETLRQNNRFLDYATLYGGVHLGRLEDPNPTLIRLLNGLFVREISCQELLDRHEGADVFPLKMNISVFCPPVESEYAHFYSGVHISILHPHPRDLFEAISDRTVERIRERPNCKSWLQLFRILSDVTRQDHPANITPLYYASLFGWNAGVERILQLTNSRATTSDLNHALRAAAIGGNCTIIRKLVDAGAQVDGNPGEFGSALQSAAFCGHLKAVEALLGLGAAAEERRVFFRPGGTVGSALQGAAIRGDTRLVQLLLDHGANVNSNRGWLGTPLQAVLERGMEDMAMFLIESQGFDGSITGGYYGSALRIPCLSGDEIGYDILRALLSKGAPSSQRVGPYGSLLELGSHFGFLDKVQLLLEYNPVLDGSVGQFGSAIHAAAMNGDERIVEALIRHGADPNFPGFWLGREYATDALPM